MAREASRLRWKFAGPFSQTAGGSRPSFSGKEPRSAAVCFVCGFCPPRARTCAPPRSRYGVRQRSPADYAPSPIDRQLQEKLCRDTQSNDAGVSTTKEGVNPRTRLARIRVMLNRRV
ncbi:hypothetical protein AAFF_G00038720 [Aldrovandia affinis]|uniref:Uncharacterized protein n=1 Tax=Aldrovandia affinis TaxID=143900 RepID=A0AAD7T5I5_9TELE|nr:hypothetical protein AAFF_G00038720 [Aldrovandia affinis]